MLQSIEIEIDANGYVHSQEPLPLGRRGILTLLDNPKSESSDFQDLFGILTAKHSVSFEQMEQAISQKAQERFDDCN